MWLDVHVKRAITVCHYAKECNCNVKAKSDLNLYCALNSGANSIQMTYLSHQFYTLIQRKYKV